MLGAYYLDAGLTACQTLLVDLFEPWLARFAAEPQSKDPKTRLQEWLQSHGLSLPQYAVTETHGAAHDQEFTVECTVHGLDERVIGRGRSRRSAEQAAAEEVLMRLERGK